MMEIEGCGWAMKLLGGQEDITPARDPARKRIGSFPLAKISQSCNRLRDTATIDRSRPNRSYRMRKGCLRVLRTACFIYLPILFRFLACLPPLDLHT